MSTDLPKRRRLLSKLSETQQPQVLKVKAILNLVGRDHVSLLPVFMQSSQSDMNILVASEQGSLVGFRKIEPKPPGVDVESTATIIDEETEKKDTKRKRKGEPAVRFLESNPTRRGVRICITCKGRIGYRSKTCKHCVKLLAVSNELSSSETLHNTLLERKEKIDTSERNDGIESEQKENENINHRPLSADHNYIQMDYQKDENMIMTSSQMFCTEETVSNIDKVLSNEPKTQEDNDYVENEVEFHWDSTTEARQVLVDTTGQEERDSPEQINIKDNWGSTSQAIQVLEDATSLVLEDATSQEERPEQINIKDEHIDNENEKVFLILKQQRKVSSGTLGPCHTTLDTCKLTECVPLEDGDIISGVFVETTSANEIKPGCPRGSKRKQAYPCKRKRKRKVKSGIQFVRIEPKPCLEEASKCLSSNAHPKPSTKRKLSGTADSFRKLANHCETKVDMSYFKHLNIEQVFTAKKHVTVEIKNCLTERFDDYNQPILEAMKWFGSINRCMVFLKSRRFLPSNPTRRGIMLCPMCQKEVGCRSKTCKHCRVAINFNDKINALNNKNLLMVELSAKTNPECTVFSLKKNITPCEERCFVRQAMVKPCTEKMDSSSTCDFVWSCECTESDGFSSTAICEHSKYLFRNPKIVQARTANLTVQKIDCLPIDNLFKTKLKQLWETNKRRELPLVQQVTLNTLVVLDIEKESPESSTEPALCVHVRFEKLKRRSSYVQPHIFCSGKSCSNWNSLESQGDSPITCLHYCISLWAIASDNELAEYFKMFLEAPQVYLHSEEFESIVSS